MKKEKKIFRWTPEELIREAFNYRISLDKNLVKWNDNYYNYNTSNFKELLAFPYARTEEAVPYGTEIRMAKCANGWMLVEETFTYKCKALSLSKTHRERLKEGYRFQRMQMKMVKKLFISNTGVASYTEGNKRRYISLSTLGYFYNYISQELTTKILCIRCNNEWLETCLDSIGNTIDYVEQPPYWSISMPEIRASNSLQQFLTRINILDHPISASWFKDMNLREIVNKIIKSNAMHNPVAYLQDTSTLSHAEKELLRDTYNMAIASNQKFYYNIKQLREKHDEMMLISLETDTTIRPIVVSDWWKEIAKDFFPEWELIVDGKRLKKEALLQRHCVGSYDGAINRGDTAILSIEHEGNRYTLELRRGQSAAAGEAKMGIYFGQLKGYANAWPSDGMIDDVKAKILVTNTSLKVNEVKPKPFIERLQDGAYEAAPQYDLHF